MLLLLFNQLSSVSVNVTGVAATGAAGDPSVSGKANTSITGVAATGSAGTATASIPVSVSLTGVEATGSPGSVTVSGKASTAVTGVTATGSAGSPTVTGTANVSPTGLAATGSAGEVVAGPTIMLVPDADDTDGGWTNELDGSVLYDSINELTPDNDDYIQSSASPDNDECIVHLTDLGSSTAPFQLQYRYWKTGVGQIDLTVRLLGDGYTEIAAWTHTDIGAEVTAVQDLSAGETADVLAANDLYIAFKANAA